MPYYDVANLVTLTKTNLIHEMPCGYGILRTTAVRNTALSLPQGCTAVSNSSPSHTCSKIWPSYKSNLVASWMHLHNCRCFQEHLRMLFQSLRTLPLAPGGPGSIWNHLGVPVRSTGVSGRFACGFRTDLHFADAVSPVPVKSDAPLPACPQQIQFHPYQRSHIHCYQRTPSKVRLSER